MKRTTLRAGALTAVALTIPSAALAADLKPELAGHESVRSHMREGARDVAKDRLVKRVRALDSSASRRSLRRQSVSELRERLKTLRAERRAERTYERVAVPGVLASIAACESGGNPRAIGGGGLYRGKYQFDHQTWAAVGGSGDPAAASEAEQDMRAALLYQRAGSSPWPVCG